MTKDPEVLAWRDRPSLDQSPILHASEGPRLLGSECQTCSARFFPERPVCFECMAHVLTSVPLSPSGVLYSFTTVHVSASRPTPYRIGFVDLDDEVRVLAELRGTDIAIGTPVRLGAAADAWWFTSEKEQA